MSALSLAADNGPIESVWNAMAEKSDHYALIIARYVGYCLFINGSDQDRMLPPIETLQQSCAAFAELTRDELYFVTIGAINVLTHHDCHQVVCDMAKAWMDEGAPE